MRWFLLGCLVLFFGAPVAAQTVASPNCTRVVAGGATITFNGAAYTVSAAKAVLRGGSPVAGGLGTPLVVVNNELQVLGLDGKWWRLNAAGTAWALTGADDPCPPPAIVTKPPVDPVTPPTPVVPPNAVPAQAKLAWTQPAASLAAILAMNYKMYLDAATVGVPLPGVACTAAVAGDGTPVGEFPCTAPFPATTPGPHTLQVTASNTVGESPKSNVMKYDLQPIPLPPSTLRAK